MRTAITLIIAALLGGCVTPMRDQWVPSPNFNERKPNYIIIHQTDSVSHQRALNTLTDPVRGVSAHYLIAKDGQITQLVEERHRAWHAGKSWWSGQTDMNSASIGIELDHQGDQPFEAAQMAALVKLLHDINGRYSIPPANILGHGDVAVGRKVDPNYRFPWEALARQGFGLWCDANEAAASADIADSMLALQALGYDIRQQDAALAAFRRHFRGSTGSGALDEDERRLLACLLKKKTPASSNGSAPTANGIGQ